MHFTVYFYVVNTSTYAFNPQLKSFNCILEILRVAALNNLVGIVLLRVITLLLPTETKSYPSSVIIRYNSGIFWTVLKSASIVITTSPDAALKPDLNRHFYLGFSKEIALTLLFLLKFLYNLPAVIVEPSFTKIISYVYDSLFIPCIQSVNSGRLSSSLKSGITILRFNVFIKI